ncbi:MAG: hypothetical protein METHSR3v1_1730006 [Methanothrix sp.]|nr:MAG: hypothetical protein METHSR3v1_1730006 [Methanothrix sp.]
MESMQDLILSNMRDETYRLTYIASNSWAKLGT